MENIIKPATAEVKKNKRRKKPTKPTTQVVENKEIKVAAESLPIIVAAVVDKPAPVFITIIKPKTLIEKIKAWFKRN